MTHTSRLIPWILIAGCSLVFSSCNKGPALHTDTDPIVKPPATPPVVQTETKAPMPKIPDIEEVEPAVDPPKLPEAPEDSVAEEKTQEESSPADSNEGEAATLTVADEDKHENNAARRKLIKNASVNVPDDQ